MLRSFGAQITFACTTDEARDTLPVIFYIGESKLGAGTPAAAFGITYRPDVLLTLVADALGRVRSG